MQASLSTKNFFRFSLEPIYFFLAFAEYSDPKRGGIASSGKESESGKTNVKFFAYFIKLGVRDSIKLQLQSMLKM